MSVTIIIRKTCDDKTFFFVTRMIRYSILTIRLIFKSMSNYKSCTITNLDAHLKIKPLKKIIQLLKIAIRIYKIKVQLIAYVFYFSKKKKTESSFLQ